MILANGYRTMFLFFCPYNTTDPATLKSHLHPTHRFCLYLKLITLAGITWIFEVLSFYYGDTNHGWNVWLIADVVNGLHGLGVFVVLVVCRRRIRKELGNKRILCFRTPASWAAESADSDEGGLHSDGMLLWAGFPMRKPDA